MWHRFGPDLQKVVLSAAARAEEEGAPALSTRHLLWGLAAEGETPAAQILARVGVSPRAIHDALSQAASCEGMTGRSEPELTPEARNIMETAYRLAVELDDQQIGSEHLLLALIREPQESDAGRVLSQTGVTWEALGQALMTQQKWRARAPEGVSISGLSARRFKVSVRRQARRIKMLAYGLASYSQNPFMQFLLFRKATTSNPYPFYARLRCQPAYWDSLLDHWVVTGYNDVVAALAEARLSPRIFSVTAWSHTGLSPLVQREFRCVQSYLDQQMLFQNAPVQPRQRARISARFTPRVIAQMQAQMRDRANELLDQAEAAGRMEMVAEFATPFPLLVITRMLGLPVSDQARFKKWADDYMRYLTFNTTLADDLAVYQSVRDAAAYIRPLISARRQKPEEDLITLLIQADDQGEFLADEEVIANCLLMLAAGHDTTTRLLSSGLFALLRYPDQWQKLCADPSLVGGAVEELLRYDSPVQWTIRYVHEDFEWRGYQLKKGQQVHIGLGPANHDVSRFSAADRVDITRSENRHVAFGYGSHFCLGSALARMEAQTAFTCLIDRFPGLRLEKPPVWRNEGLAFRGLEALRIRLN